jgi:hypothetical protein
MKDKEILGSILYSRLFFLEDKYLIMNNAYRLLKLLRKEYLIEELENKVNAY